MGILVAILVFIVVYHLVGEHQRRAAERKRAAKRIVLDMSQVEAWSHRGRLYRSTIQGTCYTECGGGEGDDRRDST